MPPAALLCNRRLEALPFGTARLVDVDVRVDQPREHLRGRRRRRRHSGRDAVDHVDDRLAANEDRAVALAAGRHDPATRQGPRLARFSGRGLDSKLDQTPDRQEARHVRPVVRECLRQVPRPAHPSRPCLDRHDLKELTVAVRLEGDFAMAYTAGDNRTAHRHGHDEERKSTYLPVRSTSPRSKQFGNALARHFLQEYPQVTRATIELQESLWQRIVTARAASPAPSSARTNEKRTATVTATRSAAVIGKRASKACSSSKRPTPGSSALSATNTRRYRKRPIASSRPL